MKIWITKYALTSGVFIVENAEISGTIASWRSNGFGQYAHGKDWHSSQKAAADRVEEMRLARMRSAEKSLAKLRRLQIEVPA